MRQSVHADFTPCVHPFAALVSHAHCRAAAVIALYVIIHFIVALVVRNHLTSNKILDDSGQ